MGEYAYCPLVILYIIGPEVRTDETASGASSLAVGGGDLET